MTIKKKIKNPLLALVCVLLTVSCFSGCSDKTVNTRPPKPALKRPASSGKIKTVPQELKSLTNQGAALHRKGDIDSALDHYTKANKLSSQYPNATLLNNLGALYLQKGDIKKAKDYLTQAIKISKGRYASPFINRALAKEKNKEFQSAYLDLKKAFILLDVLSPVNPADADREIMADESLRPEPVAKPRPKSRPEIPELAVASFVSPPEKKILDQPEQVEKSRVPAPAKASEPPAPEWGIQLYAVKHKIALEKLRRKLNRQGTEYFIRKKGDSI